MLLQWQLRMKPGNNTISQKSVQHSKCASLSTRGEPKMNVVQPLFLRHSQFSNYLALSQVAHCPSPLHQTQSPADFTFKCSLEASLSPPPQIIPLHPLPWLQHNQPSPSTPPLPGHPASIPPPLPNCWRSPHGCKDVFHMRVWSVTPREYSSMVLPSLKIFPCSARPFCAGLPSPHHLSRFILHFLLEQNWTIDSSLNTQLRVTSFALTYFVPFDNNSSSPHYLPTD